MKNSWIKKRILYLIYLFILSTSACQYNTIDSVESVNYQPEVALPIGVFNITIEQIIESEGLEIVDPDSIPPDASSIQYGDYHYEGPVSFDTIITTNFNIGTSDEIIEYIRLLVVRSNFINYSHAAASCQVYFKAFDTAHAFDSLFLEGPLLINTGSVRSNGTIKKFELLRNDEWFDEDRIHRLMEMYEVDIKLSYQFQQLPGEVIRYQSGELMWMQLGTRIGLDIETN